MMSIVKLAAVLPVLAAVCVAPRRHNWSSLDTVFGISEKSVAGGKIAAPPAPDTAGRLDCPAVDAEGTENQAREFAIRARAAADLGDYHEAVGLYDRAIAIRRRLIECEGRRELAGNLANCYMNKANALSLLGDNRGALTFYDRAIEIRQELVDRAGRQDLTFELAMCYMNKANALSTLGDKRAASGLYDKAIAIGDRLVHQQQRPDLANDLATCCMNKAYLLSSLGDARDSTAFYDRAIELRRQSVAVADLKGP